MSTGTLARPNAKSAKIALVAKYEHLAIVANSKAKQKQYKYKAEKYRRQVQNLDIQGL